MNGYLTRKRVNSVNGHLLEIQSSNIHRDVYHWDNLFHRYFKTDKLKKIN